MNSIMTSPTSSLSWIELGGVSYFTTYIFQGLYANDIDLGNFYFYNKFRINIGTQK